MANKVHKSICIDKECEEKLKELGGSAWINEQINKTAPQVEVRDIFWENIDNQIVSLDNQLNGIDDFKTLTKINALKRKKEINGRL